MEKITTITTSQGCNYEVPLFYVDEKQIVPDVDNCKIGYSKYEAPLPKGVVADVLFEIQTKDKPLGTQLRHLLIVSKRRQQAKRKRLKKIRNK